MDNIICGEGLLSQITSVNTFNYEELTVEKLEEVLHEVFESTITTTSINMNTNATYGYPVITASAFIPSSDSISCNLITENDKFVEEKELTFEDILLIENENNIKNL